MYAGAPAGGDWNVPLAVPVPEVGRDTEASTVLEAASNKSPEPSRAPGEAYESHTSRCPPPRLYLELALEGSREKKTGSP